MTIPFRKKIPKIEIIHELDCRAQGAIDLYLNRLTDLSRAKKSFVTPECPWVKVGNLFLTVTYSGNESWVPLVAYLRTLGHEKFTIFGGRHGAPEGDGVSLSSGLIANDEVFVPEYHVENMKQAKKLSKDSTFSHQDCFEIIDVSKPLYRQISYLRKMALEELNGGRTVIFAWCYSLACMMEYDDALPQGSKVDIYHASVKKSIGTIVRETLNWVPRNHASGSSLNAIRDSK